MSISVFDQMLNSFGNFAIGVFLVRTISPFEFGMYSIGIVFTLFFIGIGNATFLVQMVVNTPDRGSTNIKPYASKILDLVIIFCIVAIILGGFLAVMFSTFLSMDGYYVEYVFVVLLAASALLIRNFFVRHAYNIRMEYWAVKIDLLVAMSIVFSLWIISGFSNEVTAIEALSIIIITNALGAGYGLWLSKLRLFQDPWKVVMRELHEVYRGGRWAVMTHIVNFLRSQAHIVVVGGLVGPVGVASLSAARLLISPAMILIPAASQVFIPRLSSLRGSDASTVRKTAVQLGAFLFAVAVAYSLLLLASYSVVAEWLFSDKYGNLIEVVILWCCFSCVVGFRSAMDFGLQASRQFELLARLSSVAALVSLMAAYVLTITIGIHGSVLALVVSEVLLALLMWYYFVHCQNDT